MLGFVETWWNLIAYATTRKWIAVDMNLLGFFFTSSTENVQESVKDMQIMRKA